MYAKYSAAIYPGMSIRWAKVDSHETARTWKEGLDEMFKPPGSKVECYSLKEIQQLTVAELQDMPVWMSKEVLAG